MNDEKNMIEITTEKYNIYIKDDLFKEAHNYLNKFQKSKECFIITDKHVYNLYKNDIQRIFKDYHIFVVAINPGEKSKSLKTYNKVINVLLKNNIKRHHVLIALGGGVVGDLTGFIASTLFRGIDYIQIPTTLLAQVDSSIGGKTGVDLAVGKNLVGSFYSPKVVLIDPLFLKTLTKRHYNNGMAEIIKVGLIFDENLYNMLKSNFNINEIIHKAILVKKHFVTIDPFDKGERKKLNFGHTFGHALESSLNYKHLYHGEAITIGMLYAVSLGERLDVTNKLIYDDLFNVLERFDLIRKMPRINANKFNKALKLDKKSSQEGVDFILITNIGESIIKNIPIGMINYEV